MSPKQCVFGRVKVRKKSKLSYRTFLQFTLYLILKYHFSKLNVSQIASEKILEYTNLEYTLKIASLMNIT